MKSTLSAIIFLIFSASTFGAGNDPDPMSICLFSGAPPAGTKYEELERVKVGKGTYGGVKDILPAFAQKAHKTGANAVMNYSGSQRFGFWPWMFIRPVVYGTGIKMLIEDGVACSDLGGTTISDVISNDKAPEKALPNK